MTNEIIGLVLKEIRARRYPEAKKLLDELSVELEKLENLQEFFDEIKKLCKDSGTNIISISQIKELITKYGEKK